MPVNAFPAFDGPEYDRIDREVAACAPTQLERRWASLPWSTDAVVGASAGRKSKDGVLVVVLTGALAPAAIGLGRRAAWGARFLTDGVVDAMRGALPACLDPGAIATAPPEWRAIRRLVERLPAGGDECGISLVAWCDENGNPRSVWHGEPTAEDLLRSMARTGNRGVRTNGPMSGPTTNPSALSGAGFHIESALRRDRSTQGDKRAWRKFPVEMRSFSVDDAAALALGPPTAHGEIGQRWSVPRVAAAVLWNALAPVEPSEMPPGFPVSIRAEVSGSGKGCRVAYQVLSDGTTERADPGRTEPVRIAGRGYGVFGADRMPRVLRFAVDATSSRIGSYRAVLREV